MQTKAIEEAEEIIEDQAIVIALQNEELTDLRQEVRILRKQVQSLMNAQKVEYA
jgi:hypothetical protein